MKWLKAIRHWWRDARGIPGEPSVLAHVYSEPLTAEVWAYGQDTCIYCGRYDAKRTRYTVPGCPRIHGYRPDAG